jgi:hypothetical protein
MTLYFGNERLQAGLHDLIEGDIELLSQFGQRLLTLASRIPTNPASYSDLNLATDGLLPQIIGKLPIKNKTTPEIWNAISRRMNRLMLQSVSLR